MFDDGALALSLPALELERVRLPGSVFSAADIATAEVSPQLRLALDLIVGVCRESGFEPTFVARPEIFSSGESLAWLTKRLNGAKDHLALSDGTAIRLIPGLRNHVFLFGLDRAADAAALQKLERRAPELFGALQTQVNTARRFASGRESPASVAISGVDALEREAPQFYRIALNAESVEDSVARTLRSRLALRPGQRFDEIDYVALTESSLADERFGEWLAEKLNLVYFDPRRALILRIPANAGASRDVEARVRATLAALVAASPRVPLAAAVGAWLTTGDLTADRLSGLTEACDFLAPESFDFWRHSPRSYAGYRRLRVHTRARRLNAAAFAEIVASMTGRPIEVVGGGDDEDSQAPRAEQRR